MDIVLNLVSTTEVLNQVMLVTGSKCAKTHLPLGKRWKMVEGYFWHTFDIFYIKVFSQSAKT